MEHYNALPGVEVQLPHSTRDSRKSKAVGIIIAALLVFCGVCSWRSSLQEVQATSETTKAKSSSRIAEISPAGSCAEDEPIPGSDKWWSCNYRDTYSCAGGTTCCCAEGHTWDQDGKCVLCTCNSNSPINGSQKWVLCHHLHMYRCGSSCCCANGYSADDNGFCRDCLWTPTPATTVAPPPAPSPASTPAPSPTPTPPSLASTPAPAPATTPAPYPAPMPVPVPAPACYSGSATVGWKTEYVNTNILSYSDGEGSADVQGSGIKQFSCHEKPFEKNGTLLILDLSDCAPQSVVISSLKYNSRHDTISGTVHVEGTWITRNAVMHRKPCNQVGEELFDSVGHDIDEHPALDQDSAEEEEVPGVVIAE